LTTGKQINTSGLKYLENFTNPYVKIILACRECNKEQSPKYPTTWKRHYLTHASKEEKPHKCPHCDKAFVTSSNLKSHMKSHFKKIKIADGFSSNSSISQQTQNQPDFTNLFQH